MNQLYPKGRELFATGQLDWRVGTYRAALVYDSYNFRENDAFVSDLGVFVAARSESVNGRTADGGMCDANNIIFLDATSTQLVGKVVVFLDAGDDEVSPLIAYYDDIVGLPNYLDGGRYDVWVDRAFGGLWRI